MVFTRSKKRSLEEPLTLKVDETFSNIHNVVTSIKRQKYDPDTTDVSDDDVEPEWETETDTIATTIDITDTDTDTDTDPETFPQIASLIRNSVRHLFNTASNTASKGKDEVIKGEVYEQFMTNIDSIYSGAFFERVPIEEKKKQLQEAYTQEQIKELNEKLLEVKRLYKDNAPSIVNILNMNVSLGEKQKLIEKLYNWSNSEILTTEYNSNLKYLINTINKDNDLEMTKLEGELSKFVQSDNFQDDFDCKKRILKSNMSFENKAIAYKKYAIMETYEDTDSSEYAKYKTWIDTLLTVPFGKYIDAPSIDTMSGGDIKSYIANVRHVLDKRLSFLENPKDQIINMVTQMIRNPSFHLNAIGLYGSRGTGKTNLCKSIAEALGRPFRIISLGGESDSSTLTGHNFTYVGSSPGRIIEILKETKCMNPVVLIDELDKVSETQHGKEIIGNLIHLTDSTTNIKYNYDRYFSGVEFDLSKVLFVFTYNDPSKVDRILADRLFKIKVNNYTLKEKLEITNKHLVGNILEEYKFGPTDVTFTQDAISYIVESSKGDEGMREIKRKFEIIVSRVNTLLLTDKDEHVIKLKYKCLYDKFKSIPAVIEKQHVDILLNESMTNDNDQDKGPPFGMYI